MKLSHSKLKEYYKSIHEKSVDFTGNSFFRVNPVQIAGSFFDDAKYPSLVIEAADGDLGSSSEVETVATRTTAFTVYMNPDRHDYNQQDEFIDKCENIGFKILQRMRHDSMKPDHFLNGVFDKISWSWIQVGPIFTNQLYGYRFMGQLKSSESLQINHNDWSDLDSNC